MSDPFRPEANQQLLREARVGLTLLAITLGTFVYVAYYRISGNGQQLPDYVVNAPIAEAVWPGENPLPLAEKNPAPQTLGSQFGSLLASARDKFSVDPESSPAAGLRQKKSDYKDPLPKKDIARIPQTKLPEREKSDAVELAAFRSDTPPEPDQNSFASQIPRATSPKPSIDNNELRSARAVTDAPADFAPGFVKQIERLSQQQPSTLPVIVTPEKDCGTDFAAELLRPYCESKNSQTSQCADAETNRRSPTPSLSNRLRSEHGEQQITDDNSFSREGSKISSQVITSDIAADLTGQTPESATQRPLERQISFNAKSTWPMAPVATEERLPKSDRPNSAKGAESTPPIEQTAGNPQEHLVRAGESFWSIAQEHYQDGRFFRALYEYNKQSVGSFENLLPGSTLATPSKTELIKLWPELCPRADDSSPVSTNINERIYVTQQGDTLFEIARQRLAQASRYLEIQKLNELRLPAGTNHLSPLPAGISLVLPLDVTQ